MELTLKFITSVTHLILEVVVFTLTLWYGCRLSDRFFPNLTNVGCFEATHAGVTYSFSVAVITMMLTGGLVGLHVIRKSHNTVEKIVWMICHYLVYAAAVTLSNVRGWAIVDSGFLIAACVFLWLDFAVYLLELTILLGILRAGNALSQTVTTVTS